MPFTIDGQWIPSKDTKNQANPSSGNKPVKVRLVKRGNNILTVIHNLNMQSKEMTDVLSSLKKKLGCGGTIKEQNIEIQGDKVEQVVKYLADKGIKTS